MFVGTLYCIDEIEDVCPWCIADGSAARKWDATFNNVDGATERVPKQVLDEIRLRTPNFETWQDYNWLFSDNDALVFVGEVDGKALLAESNDSKIEACLSALSKWNFGSPVEDVLPHVKIGGQPAVYLFRDRDTGFYRAFSDAV